MARLDRRLASRVDASDVVQDTLADAAGQLDDYLLAQPIPFLPWLRQIAVDRIRNAHRRHLVAQSRSVVREQPDAWLSEGSAVSLGQQFVANGTSPSNHVMRQELCDSVMAALASLPARDREVLLMRHVEKLKLPEIALALGMAESAIEARLYRALTKLRVKLEGQTL